MIDNPAISVVFTSYNHREYLRQALDALINQTFRDFELIIVDDCSTDGSQEILKEYAKKDSRIRLFLNERNGGSYVISTNYGASLANAPYIIFAQCDDWAEPTQLERLYDVISKENVSVVFSASNMVDEKGNFICIDLIHRSEKFIKELLHDSKIYSTDAFDYLIESCIIPNLSAAIIRTERYRELGGLSSDFLVLADWDFWLRLSQRGDFYYIKAPLNNFRQHKTTIRSSVKIEKQIKELLLMYSNAINIEPRKKSNILSFAAFNWIINIKGNYKNWFSCFWPVYKNGLQLSGLWPIYFLKAVLKCCYIYVFKRRS